MPQLALPISLLALVSGIGSLCVAAFLVLKYRTALLRHFLVADAGLFLMTTAFAMRSVWASLLWIARASPSEEAIGSFTEALVLLGAVLQFSGAISIVAILPFLICGLFERQLDDWYRRVGLGSALALVVLGLASQLDAGGDLAITIASALLFGNVALAILFQARWLAKQKKKTSGAPSLVPAAAVKAFLILSACFLPLFIADAFFLGTAAAAALAAFDDTTVPLYFIFLNLGCLGLARRNLDHPPLMEEDKVSDYGKEFYGLTAREAEVLEYVIDGYGVKDLASVLGIAPKTAENHLQSIYRKTGVNNRIQLFQAFQLQRRSR